MTPAHPFHWDVNPILVQVGALTVRWYGVFFAAAFLVGYRIMQGIYRREGADPAFLDRLLLYMSFEAVLGARVGHVLFYDPHYYATHPLEIVKIWEGGLASHGGAVGILVALYLLTRREGGPPYPWLLDRVAIPIALGGAFIRLGNLFNSEIVGTPTSGWWGVVFDRVDSLPRHPVQLYEAIAYGLIYLLLLSVYRHRGPPLGAGGGPRALSPRGVFRALPSRIRKNAAGGVRGRLCLDGWATPQHAVHCCGMRVDCVRAQTAKKTSPARSGTIRSASSLAHRPSVPASA